MKCFIIFKGKKKVLARIFANGKYRDRRKTILNRRNQIQEDIDNGKLPNFLDSTKSIRESNYKINPILESRKRFQKEIH